MSIINSDHVTEHMLCKCDWSRCQLDKDDNLVERDQVGDLDVGVSDLLLPMRWM